MSIEIRVPAFGESVVEATVGRWLKAEGERVAPGEPVVELETEKVNTEVAAEEGGVLTLIAHKEGDTVRPGDLLGTVEPAGETAAGPSAPLAAGRAAPPSAPPPPEGTVPPSQTPLESEKMSVSPLAQRLAADSGVDLAQVRGTGPGGRIMKEDVETHLRQKEGAAARATTKLPEAPSEAPAFAVSEPTAPSPGPAAVGSGRQETRQRLTRRRLTIARRLVEAQQTAVMTTTFNEIDMSAVVDLRRRRRESFRGSSGVDLGYMSFFVKAVVGALKAFPRLNAELQGEELVLKHYYDLGIALGDPEGLVVPVLRDADRLTFAQIEQGIAGFVEKTRDRALSLEDLRGGTFTITNGGVFGSLLSTPILNPPQVGILGMHKIAERPMAVGGQVLIRPTMYVALTYDHRVVDGREAVLFLVRMKELIEDPERLLLEG